MRDPQRVSIVVTTKNSALTLDACLGSIRAQDHSPLELIVVDNSSSDDTLKLAEKYADIVDIGGPERSAQRNAGASLATADYLFFVDSDMILGPKVVSEGVAGLLLTDAPAIIVPEVSIGEGFWTRCRALERSCYRGDDLIEAARFFRRESFESAGGYDESLVAGEDWDLSIRVSKGRHLPRTGDVIWHDESGLSLGQRLTKKRYYGGYLSQYWRKHRSEGIRQANLVLRPAFIRNWRLLLRHPILTLGVLTLKGLEGLAALTGAVEFHVRSNRGDSTQLRVRKSR